MFNNQVLNRIGTALLSRHETIAVAESVTSGLLQFSFSNIPDASQFFAGGVTTYNLDQKCRQLQVDHDHAALVNCVSEKVAAQMALGVSTVFESDWQIAITGYATPVPESGNSLFAYFAIGYKEEIVEVDRITPAVDDPQEVQLFYVNTIIERLGHYLEKMGM